jgi:UDP-N-acetylglucosamine/UDP-N-acetylgalactosamine diphosphorylase
VEVKPLPKLVTRVQVEEERDRLTQIGYDEICAGRVAVLLLAGGQGTRLGCNDPKGMYDVGLLSHKSLFQIQAERLLLVQRLAASACGIADHSRVTIPWYIMTSFVTDTPTQQYFSENGYFGLKPSQLYFFNQDLFPCVQENGLILMQSKSEISIAPNGNGGLWSALYSSGALSDMEKRGVEIVASYGVDNVLAKVADPLFIGFTKDRGTPIACKAVSKTTPDERVGVLCLKDNKPSVIEYSEISPEQAHEIDPATGTLRFNAAHIIMNNFTVDFIKKVVHPDSSLLSKLPYHIAKKKIPCIDENGSPTEIMGWKFELFVFDVFEFASELCAMEVIRSDEFSPLKNSVESRTDNPITCRQHLSLLHQKWVTKAGGKIERSFIQTGGEDPLFEVSTSLSYDGEGLEELVQGKTFQLPYYLQPSSLNHHIQ